MDRNKSLANSIDPDFAKCDGLVPVVVQDATSRDVLMVAYMNAEAYKETLSTGVAVYYSRSRGRLWKKGETSGHLQRVKQIRIDCDRDAVLLIVEQVGGAACHTGYSTCFYRDAASREIVAEQIFNPAEVYKNHNRGATE